MRKSTIALTITGIAAMAGPAFAQGGGCDAAAHFSASAAGATDADTSVIRPAPTEDARG